MERRYAHLLSPIRVRNFVLKNRMINSQSISQELQGPQIWPGEAYQRYTQDYAKNGAAMVNITVGSWPNEKGEHGFMDQFYMENRKVLNEYAKQIDRIHAYGSLVSGSVSLNLGRDGQLSKLRNPGIVTMRGDYGGHGFFSDTLPEYTKEQFRKAIEVSARRAADLGTMGLDCVNVHMSYRSGVLANSLSPALNQREDEYGGSLENRCRLPLEYFKALREALGPNKLIQCQISGIEEPPYGYTVEDFLYFCEKASEYVDIFQIRGWDGSTSHTSTYNFSEHEPYCLQFSEAFKKRGIKALCAPIGGFQNPDDMEKFIAEGKADLICMARAFICDPEFNKKLMQGRGEDIIPCIRCDRCHGAVCSVNPRVGLSHVFDTLYDAPEGVKKVAVIGGGPAGMKAALTAAERGHKVTLFEKSDHLGGQLIHADKMAFKIPLRRYKEYLVRQVGKADVDVRLNTDATTEMIAAGGYDAVIAACGAVPNMLDIPGADASYVIPPIEVFGNEEKLGEKIVVVGGAMTGTETACHLSQLGKSVTLITRQKRPVDDHESHAERVFRELIIDSGIKIQPLSQTTRIEDGKVYCVDADGVEHCFEADTVVVSAGISANVDECMKFAGLSDQFFVVGDSDVKVCELFNVHFVGPEGLNGGKLKTYEPNVRHATFSAYTAASMI
ncbi:MAG: FAD-dependent oxidoreductase [Ruminococcaceae bacterium]|nr:FAD-dependent oxidoreductase [Oscillospiraceae bacterium]